MLLLNQFVDQRIGGQMSRISVLMPVYNHPSYVGLAIESILSQSFDDFEFLLMDDGSQEETRGILQEYSKRDSRIRLYLRPHRGICATRNELLAEASSTFVAWIDCDDVATPDRLGRQIEVISRDKDLWVLGTAVTMIDERGRQLRTIRPVQGADEVARQMMRGCKVAQSSSMMRREPILALGGYRAAYETTEDYDLFLRISERAKLDNIDFVGLHMRSHSERASAKHSIYQAVLANMAQATHVRRVAGLSDPTNMLKEPPALFDDPILDDLLGDKITVYRVLKCVEERTGDPEAHLETLVNSNIQRKQRSACQRAIVDLVRRRPLDLMSVKAILKAATMGPGRLIQQFWAWQPQQ